MPASNDPIEFIRQRFGIELKKVGRDEWAGACPWCSGTDRYHVWRAGNFWCRPGPGHCGRQGWVDQLDGYEPPTQAQKLEWRVAELERKQHDQETRIDKLEQMHKSQAHLQYHHALTEASIEYWAGEGMVMETIDRYLLGWCHRCPTDHDGRASYTIPIINRGVLENIRHRLIGADNGDKYRPHMAGLGNSLFNVDVLDRKPEAVIVTEGEKKTIVLDQSGFDAVGICGKRSFKREWLSWFERIPQVYIALDPDAMESAYKLAEMFGDRARVMRLPAKIDDLIVKYHAGAGDIDHYMRAARRGN